MTIAYIDSYRNIISEWAVIFRYENFFIPRVEEISIPEKRPIRNSYIFKTSHVIEFVNCDCTYLTILVTANFCSLFCSILLSKNLTLLSWFSSFWAPFAFKVRIFWEGHKIWKNLPLTIWRYSVTSNFMWKIFSNFLTFSEYLSEL